MAKNKTPTEPADLKAMRRRLADVNARFDKTAVNLTLPDLAFALRKTAAAALASKLIRVVQSG